MSYLETALWSSGDEDELDGLTVWDFSPEALLGAWKDVYGFLLKAASLFSDDDKTSHPGHDFWLTRNGHGAGFWDGDYTNGDALTAVAKEWGEIDPYLGDDGLVYMYGQ